MSVPSLRRWVADLIASPGGHELAVAGGRLSARGGATGTPSHDVDEAPPSLDQETNQVVSGGGVVNTAGRVGPSHKAVRSR